MRTGRPAAAPAPAAPEDDRDATSPRADWPALIKLRSSVTRENAPLARMLERYGSPQAALRAPADVWRELCGFVPRPDRLGPDTDRRAEDAAATLEERGARVLDIRQAGYPDALRRLPQPPAVLFLLGRVELLGRPAVAVVGARAHSAYGRDAAVSFAVGLVRSGYAVTSGLARGIDALAHGAALEAGGDTIAVLGSGLDVVYPPEHEELFTAIARSGCLLSEFPPGTPPRKHHFPQRNRIIAGLSSGVLVVEATERSGALITANYALEEGKDVFAVPGPIYSPTSRGTHRLIQDGAALVTSAADLVQILSLDFGRPRPASSEDGPHDAPAVLDAGAGPADPAPLARRLWDLLARGSRDFDQLAGTLDVGAEVLSAALLELELGGWIHRLPGARYARRSDRPG